MSAENDGSVEVPRSSELRKQWHSLDAGDAHRIQLYERFSVTHALLERAKTEGDAALARELELECYLFARFGSARTYPTPQSAPTLASPEGIAFLRGRLTSPSLLVRALAGRFLFAVAKQEFPQSGRVAADAYLGWFRHAAERALGSHSADWALQAVGILDAGLNFCRVAVQHSVQQEFVRAATQFVIDAASVGLGGWAASCAEGILNVPKKILKASDVTGLNAVLRAEAARAHAAHDFHYERRHIEAAMRLRRAAQLPGSDTVDWETLARSHEAEARSSGSAMHAEASFRDAVQAFRRARKPEEVRRVSSLLSEASARVHNELREFGVSATISRKDLEEFFRPFERAPIFEALRLVGGHPHLRLEPEVIAATLRNRARQTPLQYLVPHKLQGPEGTFFSPPSEGGQLELHFDREALWQLEFDSHVLLTEIFRRLGARGLDVDCFAEVLLSSNVFDVADRPILERGIRHWFSGDYYSCLHVIVPALERILRRLCQRLGISTISVKEDGAEQIALDAVLSHLSRYLPSFLSLELQLVLSSRAAWTLRHHIAHGLVDVPTLSASKAARVLRLYLSLGLLSIGTKQENRGDLDSFGPKSGEQAVDESPDKD